MSWCLADVVEAHGDVGMSGGYGLWGPAVGQTIYPDMQPTVDDLRKRPSPEAPIFPAGTFPDRAIAPELGYPQGVPMDLPGSVLYSTETMPSDAVPLNSPSQSYSPAQSYSPSQSVPNASDAPDASQFDQGLSPTTPAPPQANPPVIQATPLQGELRPNGATLNAKPSRLGSAAPVVTGD
jgi:hypothetical protein